MFTHKLTLMFTLYLKFTSLNSEHIHLLIFYCLSMYSLNVQGWKSTLLGVVLRNHFICGVEIHSKIVESTLKILECTLKRVIQITTLEWIPL